MSRCGAVAAGVAIGALAWLAAACSSTPPAPPPAPPPGPEVAAPPEPLASEPLAAEPPPAVPLPSGAVLAADPLLARVVLPNGLDVAVLRCEADPAQMAEFVLTFASGTDHGKQGAADLAAHLFVHGADLTAGRQSLHRRIAQLGGSLSIEQGLLSTWFTVRIAQDRWRQALTALAQTVMAPPPSRGLLERAHQDLLKERGAGFASAPLQATVTRMLLGDRGGAEHLEALQDRDPSEGVLFQSRHYRPDRAVLALRVPGEAAVIENAVRGEFTPWRAAAMTAEAQPGPHGRRLQGGVWWAESTRGAAVNAAAPCRVGLVFGLPDPARADAAAVHMLLHCVTMDGIGSRLERLQHEERLGAIEWEPTLVSCAEASALVLATTATADEAVRLWKVATRARLSLRDLGPTDSERAFARGRAWLSMHRAEADASTALRARLLRIVQHTSDQQLAERLSDLEQPDALSGSTIAAFLELPMALVVVGGNPPAGFEPVQRFEFVPPDHLVQSADAPGDALVVAARPWLDKAVAAVGGRDRVARITGLRAGMNIVTDGAPDIAETFTWSRDGGLQRSRTILGVRVDTDIRGSEWIETCAEERLQLSAIEASWRLSEVERHPIALLSAYARQQLDCRLLAGKTEGGREHVMLEAVSDRFERLRLQLDRESGLVRVVESWTTSPEGLPTRSVDTWSDYRTVDGFRLPFRRVTVVDDGQSRRVADFTLLQPKLVD